MPRRRFLAERDSRAFRIVDNVVLDDPALGPVWADEAGLFSCRGGPWGSRLRQLEAAHSDVVDMVLGGVKHRPAHIDFNKLGVGVGPLEVGPDSCRILTDLCVPDETGLVGVAHPVGNARPVIDHLSA